jgi:hypothetical protein
MREGSTAERSDEETTVPVRSSVSVASPRRMVATYVFASGAKYSASRVAGPTHTSSSPDAKGSSVPVCPTWRIPRERRTAATASWEVGPAGLSMGSTPRGPSRLRVVRLRLAGAGLVVRERLAQQRLDPHRLGEHAVGLEVQLGDPAHVQALAQLLADEGGGAAEPREDLLPLLLGPAR